MNSKKQNKDFWFYVTIFITIIGMVLVIDRVLRLGIFASVIIYNSSYLYSLLGTFLSLVFIYYPGKRGAPRTHVPWYDAVFFLFIIGVNITFVLHGYEIMLGVWQFAAPNWAIVLAVIQFVLVLEALRRVTGWSLTILCVVFASYPTFAGQMPGILEGQQFSIFETIGFHVLSEESILGVPMAMFGRLIASFMIFGAVLMMVGGGDFFYKLAMAFFGHQRGGPAKVAVVASGLFGSMSGSAVSNVITSGSVTIPAMKRTGYSSTYAAAIEACASTGGMITPPIMGATAFLIPTFTGLPYLHVVVAAIIPALLYYFALFIQVDGYAAKHNLTGMEKSKLAGIKELLIEGWPYAFTFGVLIYYLIMRLEARAPLYGALALLISVMINRELTKQKRLTKEEFLTFFRNSGKILSQLVAILAGVGPIIGSFIVTGLAHSISREIIYLIGDFPFLILIVGAITCYFLGMGMTITASYIFIAILIGPALEGLGFNVLAVHLFILYFANTSLITPPVAVAAFVAAGIAEAPSFKTGFTAMRLGIVLFLAPFFFVYQPALILQAPLAETILPLITAFAGIFLLSGSLEGYLAGTKSELTNFWRLLCLVGGIFLAVPERITDVISLGIIVLLVTKLILDNKKEKKKEILV